ncbi:MAG: STN domain-containing protein [Phycisphaerae bacterium]|jgi:hypothetical protein
MHSSSRNGCLLTIAAVVSLMLAGGPAAGAQDLRDLVEEVLDQHIDTIKIEETPLPEALGKLGDETGLSFIIEQASVDWMPYGANTRVSIDMRGVSVRQGLERTLAGLGLAARVEADKIVIVPGPALERLGRRLTIDEVRLLGQLAETRWADLPAESRTVRTDGKTPTPDKIETAVAGAAGANAAVQLERAGEQGGWRWVPEEGHILVYSQASDIERRLARTVDLSYEGVPLDEVLLDLGQLAGVTMRFEPGVLVQIQAHERLVNLIHHGTTVRQTLELLCGSAGTTYQIADGGVLIGLAAGKATPGPAPQGRVVAILRVPVGDDGTCVEFPFYEDNLPPEFSKLLEQKLPVVLDELRARQGQ